MLKVLTHIKFIKTCKLGHFIPIFSYLKLAIKNGNLKSKIAHLIMETELQSKKKKKTEKEDQEIFYNCLIHQINIASKIN